MESNNHHEDDDSKSSSEETDRSEQGNDDIGTGRSYECVFCKRGFTTAQALGGHMNIHRKDRAKSRPNSVASLTSKQVDDNYYASSNFGSYSYQPIQSYPLHQHYSTASPHEVHVNYQTFFPAPTWVMSSTPPPSHIHNFRDDSNYVQNNYHHHHLNPFGGAWCEDLSLQLGPSHTIHDDEEKRQAGSDEDDLDLELRLGHHHDP